MAPHRLRPGALHRGRRAGAPCLRPAGRRSAAAARDRRPGWSADRRSSLGSTPVGGIRVVDHARPAVGAQRAFRFRHVAHRRRPPPGVAPDRRLDGARVAGHGAATPGGLSAVRAARRGRGRDQPGRIRELRARLERREHDAALAGRLGDRRGARPRRARRRGHELAAGRRVPAWPLRALVVVARGAAGAAPVAGLRRRRPGLRAGGRRATRR